MEPKSTEFNEWELLHDSVAESSSSSNSIQNPTREFDPTVDDSEGIIRADYFSPNSKTRYVTTSVATSEASSVESENPSWIDPVQENLYHGKETSELWSDSGSDRSDERKIELGLVGKEGSEVGFEGIEEKGGELGFDGGKVSGFELSGGLGFADDGIGNINTEDKDTQGSGFGLSGGSGFVDEGVRSIDTGDKDTEGLGSENDSKSEIGSGESVDSGKKEGGVSEGGEVDKRSVVWWKAPVEFLKYCMLKASLPVWSLSVAAAVMGFIILGRKLYKMKRKSRGLEIKVTVDDKKVSQFMSRTSRLNEAFSVVRRVPIVRPLLPAPGMAMWPTLGLR